MAQRSFHFPGAGILGLYHFSQVVRKPAVLAGFFLSHRTACGILVPQPGMEPMPPAVEARGLNHWTAREVPVLA